MDRNTTWGGPGHEPGVQYHGPRYQQFQQHPQAPQARLSGYQQPQQNVQYGQPRQDQHQAIRPQGQQQWQPGRGSDDQPRYQHEYAYASGEGKEVQWPPPAEEPALHHERQHGGAPLTMPLRRELPLQQEPVPVVRTVPRATTPFRVTKWRGDEKWPPEHARRKDEGPKEIVRPAKPNKDYMPFFEAHKLPPNYPCYRAPPGTQFIGIDGVEPGYYYDQQQLSAERPQQ